ncbi:mannose-6-phosphate isomerase, type 2 / mannose-1-phosphate guanylyltransferase (GDP) [Maricaulis maris MCS10]|uniref:mannose-1-phosphate guanylyltransferase n=2 Tax=Maricaulis maris TaxID=74318 RepID=Q0ALW7_MARMM|nr:mannose-6-phosphate isomerase, type 2 / mannose-1-phosphate guanylyltransferase (GDP) [Maricaulis maris MCS10]
MSVVVPVIMSGGSGTRLWPLSRASHPKQLHALVSEMSMVQETVMRVSATREDFDIAPPIIVLNERQHELARLQLTELGVAPSHYVVEPVARNTAAVAAVAAALVAREYGEEALVLLLPADHHIRDGDAFHAAITAASSLAESGCIVTFGIQPSAPETGYGYIERGNRLDPGYRVKRFTEKPDVATAQRFIATGDYYWNAGIFMFGSGTVLAEMDGHCPDISSSSRAALADASVVDDLVVLCAKRFGECPSNSFDYAIMEKTSKATVVPADIGWSDVGAWSALWDIAEDKTPEGNVARGDVHFVDTQNSYVMTNGRRVGVVGMDNVVVVVTDDAVLVSDGSRTQDVKALVTALQDEGRSELL